jgi:hypothetical protein
MGIIGLRIIRMNEIRVAIIGIVVVITGTFLLAKPTAKPEIKEARDQIAGHKNEGRYGSTSQRVLLEV